MSELSLEAALTGLGVTADEVLASHVYPDHVVVVLASGPKLTWPPLPKATPVEAVPEVKVSDEARRVAAEIGVDLKEVEASGTGGRISARDVRAAVGKRKSGKG